MEIALHLLCKSLVLPARHAGRIIGVEFGQPVGPRQRDAAVAGAQRRTAADAQHRIPEPALVPARLSIDGEVIQFAFHPRHLGSKD